MKGNDFRKNSLSYIEIFLSLFVFLFLFYTTLNYSFLLFFEISLKNSQQILSNNANIADAVGLRDDTFIDNIDEKIKIAFVGDIMLDRGVEQKINKNGNGDFSFAFTNIKEDLKKYDFLIGNLEGPVSDKGEDKHNLYSFRMELVALDTLKEVGFGAVSVANNHMGDWGYEAMIDTFNRLKDKEIEVLGGGDNLEEALKPKIIEKENTKIAILAFSEFGKGNFEVTEEGGGILTISEENLKKSIELARDTADIIIVNFHFGEEYQKIQNLYQEKYSKMAIDFGADLVVGHHPHVIQPLIQYKNAYIVYSLGNFVFDQYFSPETMEGGLLEVNIENKRISNVELKKININSDYQPSLVK